MSDSKRQGALDRYQIDYSCQDEAFDNIVELAADICEMPVAVISFLEGDRLWVKSAVGTERGFIERRESFCDVAARKGGRYIVDDCLASSDLQQNPWVVGEAGIRFYAGIPLHSPDGYRLGSLCVLDRKPRHLNEKQIAALDRLANQVMHLLELQMRERSKPDTSAVVSLLSASLLAASEGRTPELAIERALKAICQQLHAPVGHYYELDAMVNDRFVSSGIWHFDDECGYAALRAATEAVQPTLDMDPFHDPFRFRMQVCRLVGLHSAFAFPVKLNENIVGYFEFFFDHSKGAHPELVGAMTHVGMQIARVIERSQGENAASA